MIYMIRDSCRLCPTLIEALHAQRINSEKISSDFSPTLSVIRALLSFTPLKRLSLGYPGAALTLLWYVRHKLILLRNNYGKVTD